MLPADNHFFFNLLFIQGYSLGIEWIRFWPIVNSLPFFNGAINHTEVKPALHHIKGKLSLLLTSERRQRCKDPALGLGARLIILLCDLQLDISLFV